MRCDLEVGGPPFMLLDLNDICIDQDLGDRRWLAIHFGTHHLVAHVCVHMIGKVYYCGTLHQQQLPFSAVQLSHVISLAVGCCSLLVSADVFAGHTHLIMSGHASCSERYRLNLSLRQTSMCLHLCEDMPSLALHMQVDN